MKTLIVYYSRTGTTKKVGEMLAEKLDTDQEEIIDTVNRMGARGYLVSGRDAMKRNLTKLEPLKADLSSYDLVIIGTPIWGWNMSVPVRTFLTENAQRFKDVAFYCTMGGSGHERAFSEMSEIIGKTPRATLALKTAEVVRGEYGEAVDKFIADLAI